MLNKTLILLHVFYIEGSMWSVCTYVCLGITKGGNKKGQAWACNRPGFREVHLYLSTDPAEFLEAAQNGGMWIQWYHNIFFQK